MRILRTIWQDILAGRNLDVYITIVIAVMVAILGTIGIADQTVVSSAVLATLALVSASMLANRRESEDIRNILLRIDYAERLAERFFKRKHDRSIIQKRVGNSRKAFFWGLTLTITIPFLKDEIERGLQAGLEARFLIMKPSSDAVRMAAFRTRDADIDRLNHTLRTNLMHLADLVKRKPPGKLTVRVADYLPPWYLAAVDPHRSSGYMLVRLNSFRDPDASRPTFDLTVANDREWFQFFVEQFEAVWRVSEPVDLTQFTREENRV